MSHYAAFAQLCGSAGSPPETKISGWRAVRDLGERLWTCGEGLFVLHGRGRIIAGGRIICAARTGNSFGLCSYVNVGDRISRFRDPPYIIIFPLPPVAGVTFFFLPPGCSPWNGDPLGSGVTLRGGGQLVRTLIEWSRTVGYCTWKNEHLPRYWGTGFRVTIWSRRVPPSEYVPAILDPAGLRPGDGCGEEKTPEPGPRAGEPTGHHTSLSYSLGCVNGRSWCRVITQLPNKTRDS